MMKKLNLLDAENAIQEKAFISRSGVDLLSLETAFEMLKIFSLHSNIIIIGADSFLLEGDSVIALMGSYSAYENIYDQNKKSVNHLYIIESVKKYLNSLIEEQKIQNKNIYVEFTLDEIE